MLVSEQNKQKSGNSKSVFLYGIFNGKIDFRYRYQTGANWCQYMCRLPITAAETPEMNIGTTYNSRPHRGGEGRKYMKNKMEAHEDNSRIT